MDGVFPTILLIFPNQPKLNGLVKFINDEIIYSYANEGLYFMATTYQKAMTQTLLGGPRFGK